MAFAYGHMSLEDVLKYDMQLDYKMAVPVKFGIEIPYIFGVWTNLILKDDFLQGIRVAYISEEWVIDKEKDCYLRYGGMGSPQTGVNGQINFMLYYKRSRLYVALERNRRWINESKSEGVVEIFLVHAVISPGFEELRDQMLDLLKKALKVFFNGGGWWPASPYSLVFMNFSN